MRLERHRDNRLLSESDYYAWCYWTRVLESIEKDESPANCLGEPPSGIADCEECHMRDRCSLAGKVVSCWSSSPANLDAEAMAEIRQKMGME